MRGAAIVTRCLLSIVSRRTKRSGARRGALANLATRQRCGASKFDLAPRHAMHSHAWAWPRDPIWRLQRSAFWRLRLRILRRQLLSIAYLTHDGANAIAPGLDAPISIIEAEALGFDVAKIAFDYEGVQGRRMVRYADMRCGSREQAEANGFTIEPMSESMRAAIDRERADARPAKRRRATSVEAAAPLSADIEAPPTPNSEPKLSAWAAAIVESEEFEASSRRNEDAAFNPFERNAIRRARSCAARRVASRNLSQHQTTGPSND